MDVNTDVVHGSRAVFYQFPLCNKARFFLDEDVMKVVAEFIFNVPIPPPVADDYVLPTAEEVEERLQEQLALQRIFEENNNA
jgi:hypothetical protein